MSKKKKMDEEKKILAEEVMEEIEENKLSGGDQKVKETPNKAETPKGKPKEKERKPFNWMFFGEAVRSFIVGVAIVLAILALLVNCQTQKRVAELQEIVGGVVEMNQGIVDSLEKMDKAFVANSEAIVKMDKVNAAQNGKDAEDLLYILSEIGRIDKAMEGKEDKLIPPEIPVGFTPDESVIDISKEVVLEEIPDDITPYRIFPDAEGIWGDEALAGYNFGYNDAFRDSDRFGNTQIPTWSWVAYTGEEMNLSGFGSLKDKDGGPVLVVIINVWETPGEFLMAYILHGFWGTGEVWDMSDMTDNPPVYGENTLKTLAVIRNHYINQLGSDEPNPEFRGQDGKATQAETITWAVALRWYDGTFMLVDSGQWIRGQ